MCGRFTLTSDEPENLALDLGVPVEQVNAADYRPRYNIAPTNSHLIVRLDLEDRELLPAKWGLINRWAKDAKRAAKQINARAESLANSPAYRDAFVKRRCVVPADGFFEWIGSGATKQPVWFHRADGGLLLFAGLYESWSIKPDIQQRTFTIITTESSGVVTPVHNRMPVILDDDAVDYWLDSRQEDMESLKKMLAPAPEDLLSQLLVSQRANSVKNDDPSCLTPAESMPRLI